MIETKTPPGASLQQPCSANIVPMSPEGIIVKQPRPERCWHTKEMTWPGLMLDLERRTVECAKCGTVLDPFDALFALQQHMQHEREWRQRRRQSSNEKLTDSRL